MNNLNEQLAPSTDATEHRERVQTDGSTLWEVRTGERPYAYLSDQESADVNRYNNKIDLIELVDETLPRDRSLNINDNPEVGCNPNRNKQHAFFFNADNCIGCHACEAACAEKNETPSHLSFRSVGYVEGGSYPDYKRVNISMACNHCDDPVCLKGCPTKAYTKHAEYGAVLQDPDTCFGCGYCTWVCPYNAPQLDPVMGQVSKCNMCVDRLEVGLKPSCVSACVGNALDFGVVENVPENREEAKVSIPGFPDPEITHPNIRFQQVKTLPEEMKRTDSMPVKYHRDQNGQYQPVVDPKKGKAKNWNLKKLSSRENPLVLFTLLTQGSIGAFALSFLGAQFGLESFVGFSQSVLYVPLLAVSLGMAVLGLFLSTTHLGKPMRFYRGFNNLRLSPVSREGFGVALFMTFLGLHLLFSLPANPLFADLCLQLTGVSTEGLVPVASMLATIVAYLALAGGSVGIYYMMKCYRIPARPFWNHLQTQTSFGGNSLSLGSLVVTLLMLPFMLLSGLEYGTAMAVLATAMAAGILAEGLGLILHARAMSSETHEGAASYYIQTTTFGNTYRLRNVLLGLSLVIAVVVAMGLVDGGVALALFGLSCLLLILTCLIGRALFYVLVIPTTMPGAFFWRNKGFEQHARDIGLANMPQVGVVPDAH